MSVPSPVNESLLSQRLGALGSARSWAPNVLPELERFIRTADDYDLFRVNPIQYGGLRRPVRGGRDRAVRARRQGGPVRDGLAAHLRLLPAGRRQLSRARPGPSTLSVRVLQRDQRCGAGRLHSGHLYGLKRRARHHIPPSRNAVCRGFLPALQLFQGLHRSARDDAPAARCCALTGIRRYRGP